jgi:hypothetical protein
MVFYIITTYTGSLLTGGNEPRTVSLSFLNGLMVVGVQNGTAGNTGTNGVFRVDFVKDQGRKTGLSADKLFRAGIDKRNSSGFVDYLNDPNFSSNFTVNNSVNDVAMTVLPDAPIDPATGLQIPTIAVATAGGVSVIKDDGNVWDITGSAVQKAYFDESKLWAVNGGFVYRFDIPNSDGDYFSRDFYIFPTISGPLNYPLGASATATLGSTLGTTKGVANYILDGVNSQSDKDGMVAYTASAYTSGWMPGDIKGAWLAGTDTTSLVGSGELADLATAVLSGTGSFGIVGDELTVTSSGSFAKVVVSFPTIVGRTYLVSAADVAVTGSPGFYSVITSSAPTSGALTQVNNTTGDVSFYFVATTTTSYFGLQMNDSGESISSSLLSVKLADADRSVNNKGLVVNGTVARTPVATGAELVGYSGFSATNFLEQPYNAGLDFGTGDFSVMGWVNYDGLGTQTLINRGASKLQLFLGASGAISGRVGGGGSTLTVSAVVPAAVWSHVVYLRSSGVTYMYVNSRLVGSLANTGSATDVTATTKVGTDGTFHLSSKLALLRISATAPSAAQIAKIYNDEKYLFQAGAACTLYGTSDAVTALAHDDTTDLLHVGTSAGRSVFDGLRRVSNTTVAVGTAISASNNLIVEE